MSNLLTWGHHEDDDYLDTPAKRALFDMPEHWDVETDPHPNTKLANAFMDFGNKYNNSDPAVGSGFTATPATYNTGKEITQNRGYTPPSQQANNQGLLANVTKPAAQTLPEMGNFSFKAPKIQKPAVTQRQGRDSYTTPQSSPFTQTLDSVASGDIAAGTATGDLLGKIGSQYLKQGKHDVFEYPNSAEATHTADFLRETAQGTGNRMMNAGSDRAAHDSKTNYSLHFSENPAGYRQFVDKTLNDSGNAWLTTDDEYERRNIEKNADNADKAATELVLRSGHATSKLALGLNAVLTDAEAKMPTAVEVAHEVKRNRGEREDIRAQMMAHRDIRTDTPENFASDMEDYLSQTLIGTHCVTLAKVYAYRGAPFMMSNAVDMIDKSFDVWADNIIEKGDHSYINALMEAIRENHPSTDDVFINLIARFMGGNNGDALLFLWDSMNAADRHIMMKQVKQRQKAKMDAQ